MLERNGTAGLGRRGWFRSFRHGLPSEMRDMRFGSKDMIEAALIYRFAAKSMAKSLPSLGRHVRIPV
jgi:hypothetical protein